jgi:hypothetical protein
MISSHSRSKTLVPATLIAVGISFFSANTTRAQHVNTGGAQVTGLNGYQYSSLFTVGETIDGTGYTPIGILDGIGALDLGNNLTFPVIFLIERSITRPLIPHGVLS